MGQTDRQMDRQTGTGKMHNAVYRMAA